MVSDGLGGHTSKCGYCGMSLRGALGSGFPEEIEEPMFGAS